MSTGTIKLLFRAILHHLLFSLYWLRVRDSLSFRNGFFTFLLLWICLFVLSHRMRKVRFSIVYISGGVLLLFPLLRLFAPAFAVMPLPLDFIPLVASSYLFLIIPVILVFFWLSELENRYSCCSFLEFFSYPVMFAFLVGKKGWTFESSFLGSGLIWVFISMAVIFLVSLLLLLALRKKRKLLFLKDVLPLLLILGFLVLPVGKIYRTESLKEGGGLLESSLFNFDFAPFLTLESKISMKDELVFLMQKEGPVEELYLRRYILTGYNKEKGFFLDQENAYETPRLLLPDYGIPEQPLEWDLPEYRDRSMVSQNYFYVNFDASVFLGMNTPEKIIPYFSWDNSSFSRVYSVESAVNQTGPWELIDQDFPSVQDDRESRDFYQYYTDYGEQADLRNLALEITENMPGRYFQAMAIQDYLQREYLYSLSPGTSPDGDQLRYFLFDAKKGYCSYFAFSMTLLCRSLGIPSRVVLGFWVDTNSVLLNFYPVNANQAHAWVEVYFPDFGWIEFDPTSRTLAPGETFEFASYNPEELEPYIKEILSNLDHLTVSSRNYELPETTLLSRIKQTWRVVKRNPGRVLFLSILFLSLFRVVSAVLLFRGIPLKNIRVSEAYRIHKRLILILLKRKDLTEKSPRELADLCSELGIPLFQKYTCQYQEFLFRQQPPDLKAWFRLSALLRRELRKHAGFPNYFHAMARVMFLPERRRE